MDGFEGFRETKTPPNTGRSFYSPSIGTKAMRAALRKKTSTKAERIFAEILKRNHIPFEHRKVINGREVDFIVGKYAIEIDGHPQENMRNHWLFSEGYVPLHYGNRALREHPNIVEASIIHKVKPQYGITKSS